MAAGAISAMTGAGVFFFFPLAYGIAMTASAAGRTSALAVRLPPYRNRRDYRHKGCGGNYHNYLYRLHIISLSTPRLSAPEGTDSRVMPIFIGFSMRRNFYDWGGLRHIRGLFYSAFFLEGSFNLPLFHSTMHVTAAAIITAKMNTVHHQLPMR